MSATAEWAVERARALFEPPPKESIPEWALRTLRLTPSQSREHAGQPWDISRTPHAKLVFDFMRDPHARELHIIKSSAAAFSTAILVGICWHLRFRPCRVLYVITNAIEMRNVSKAILQPFLRQIFGDAVIDDKSQSTLFFRFSNGSVLQMGSPTEAFFSNKQASIVVLDEFDTYPDKLEGGSTEPLAGARGRIKGSIGFAKLFTLTAPQRKYDLTRPNMEQPGTKQHQAFLSGDQRVFKIACPGCGGLFAPNRDTLYFEHLTLPKVGEEPPGLDMVKVRAETALRCPSCAHLILERDKGALVRAGVWVPTFAENPPDIWSASYNDTCALIGNSSLGQLATELVTARSRRDRMVQVLRARFAEPESDEDVVDLSTEAVRKHIGQHKRGSCPVVPPVIALCVDCQKGPSEQQPILFKWVRVAFKEDGTQYVIDFGATASPNELRQTYESPIEYSGPPLPVPAKEDGTPGEPAPARPLYCNRAIIDSGYRAGADAAAEESMEHHVYPLCIAWGFFNDGQWVRSSAGWVYNGTWHLVPFKGRSREQMQGESVRLTSATATHPHYGQVELPLHLFNDPWFKSELYHGALAMDPLDERDPRRRRYPRIIFPLPKDELDERFYEEITAERYMEQHRRVRGQLRTFMEWGVPSKRKNDFGDCLKMARVLWALITKGEKE